MSNTQKVARQLAKIEVAMREVDLWEMEIPTQQQLASTEPFCVDTMDFPQWLRFVFMARMQTIIDYGHPLPRQSDIATMAEVYFAGHSSATDWLIQELKNLDRLLVNS